MPDTILQADGPRLSNFAMDRLLSLLLEVYDTAVPGEGTNDEFGLVTVLLAANTGGGDATLRNLRKRSTSVGRTFDFLVASIPSSGAHRSSMRHIVVLGDFTYSVLPSRLQMTQPLPAANISLTHPQRPLHQR